MSSIADAKIQPPPPSRISVRLSEDGPNQVVFMSFALLNELTPLVGGPEKMAEFDFDTQLREHTLVTCLAPRDEQRKVPEGYQLPEGFEMEQAEMLMDWAKDHVLNFFIRRLVKNLKEFETNGEALGLAKKLPPQTG